MSLAEKRGMKLPGGLPGSPQPASPPPTGAARKKPGLKLSDIGGGAPAQPNGDGQQNGGQEEKPKEQTQLDAFSQYLDPKTGTLRFAGKAVVHSSGIDFASGRSFSISLDEVDTLDELGKGNYGTVYKVRHSRPKFRQRGAGLAGNRSRGPNASSEDDPPMSPTMNRGGTTGVVMAMKEMRLELDDAKFQTIIMELDVLHRCISPYIVDFYGAFFQEGAVYICMEWMDGGSVDKSYGDGVPENVLRKITLNTVLGLKSLKEEHNIIHRDVKPTNILVNTRGQVKICDFGVSGNLVASIAKTNIGCQSYMAPERISSGGMAQAGGAVGTYSVQSDIWSLGLTIIECAMGRYPYPPETYDNIFSQLSVSRLDIQPQDNRTNMTPFPRPSSTATHRTSLPTPFQTSPAILLPAV
jgi:mitogen-activated protein kinase kinase